MNAGLSAQRTFWTLVLSSAAILAVTIGAAALEIGWITYALIFFGSDTPAYPGLLGVVALLGQLTVGFKEFTRRPRQV